ncbi:hypothetical protein IRM63_03895 [Leuconostoc citreum]|uniref:hypothetical protein n=1 Tax=Leuconostoc citreum TaxID=33964 RepID=UPI0015F75070|nr:hypothetical protein [Leuconostoc citreum]MBA5938532.1 hypothetical protein [Leuconostoc citreum]QOY98408.1 hypothetical protein IRM63_03895 [Leuconostoc citreum]
MEQIVIEEIKKLFKKKRNTLYSVRIVYIVYTDTINVFFEEQKIGEPTYSYPIGQFTGEMKEKMPDFAKRITKETKVSAKLFNL